MVTLSKQQVCQRYIFKIHSSRLRRSDWKLNLTLSDARNNHEVEEIVALADSQVLTWIDELNGITDADDKAKTIKAKIMELKKEPVSPNIKRQIRKLYTELDNIQFKPDYMFLVIDREKDYRRACEGFYINGIKYKRLLGTNGGVKMSTIVFISERLHPEITRRIENGRNVNKPLVPAKLEAYKALSCSASIPVSEPRGIAVVTDCETEFLSDIFYLNDEGVKEPTLELRKNEKVELNESDGYGIMLPRLAQRWSEELNLDYIVSGVNTRYSWEKGMVFTFDFVNFAEQIAKNYMIKDAWGNDVDVRSVELILTTSMVKLWDCYSSCEDYLQHSRENKYNFCITKTCPETLESERALNYQFIQSYNLDDDDIDELIRGDVNEINDVLSEDYVKSILFLKGKNLNEKNVLSMKNEYTKALMIEPSLLDDSYIRGNIYYAIKGRIDRAKVGVINVHGNFSMVSGDPYSLCQHIFGLEVTGLLKAGEIYNKYWKDIGADKLACFRAPMTAHPNIRKVSVHRSSEADYWYQYMETCTLLNSWDTAAHALNGCD